MTKRKPGSLEGSYEACGRNGDFHDVARICAALKMEVERLVSGLQEFADEMIPCLS